MSAHTSLHSIRKCTTPQTITAETKHLLWKRAFDICFAFLALLILSPVILLISCWIKFISRGPVIYRQTRIGQNGESFAIFKFRSMKLEASHYSHEEHVSSLVSNNLPMVKMDDLRDVRLIRGGCFLRASALDELPQLWNVLMGNMSLVGPRPCLPWEFRRFYKENRMRRFDAVPGLTGLWQVSGKNHLTFEEMVELDIQYTRDCSIGEDLKILFKTPRVIFLQLKPLFSRLARRLVSRQNAGNSGCQQ